MNPISNTWVNTPNYFKQIKSAALAYCLKTTHLAGEGLGEATLSDLDGCGTFVDPIPGKGRKFYRLVSNEEIE